MPTNPISELVEKLRARIERATNLPWYTLDPPWLPSGTETSILAGSPDPHVATFICDFDFCMMDEEDRENGRIADDPDANADLIKDAVNSLPTLLDTIERLERENADLRDDKDALHRMLDERCEALAIAEEGLLAIIARAPERDIRWAGMNACDIARASLHPSEEGKK